MKKFITITFIFIFFCVGVTKLIIWSMDEDDNKVLAIYTLCKSERYKNQEQCYGVEQKAITIQFYRDVLTKQRELRR